MNTPELVSGNLGASTIAELLVPFVGKATGAERAGWTYEDMARIGFKIVLSNSTPWVDILPQPEYYLPANQFNPNASNSNQQMGGSFVTLGNLPRLAQTVSIARKLIPDLWPDHFATDLLGPGHLDALNEVWWLKFWRMVQSVSRGPKAGKDQTDFDWQIKCNTGFEVCTINLEVKRRIGTINQTFKGKRRRVSLVEVAKKFDPVPEDTCNVVALTVYHPIDRAEWKVVLDWLDDHPNIHGVVIWMEGGAHHDPFRFCFKPSRTWAKLLLNEPDDEDHKVAGIPFGTTSDGLDIAEYWEQMMDPPRVIVS